MTRWYLLLQSTIMSKPIQIKIEKIERIKAIKDIGRGPNERKLLRYLFLSPESQNWAYKIARGMSKKESPFYTEKNFDASDVVQAAEPLIRKSLAYYERSSVDGKEENLLHLTSKGHMAAIYLEEGFLNGQSDISATEPFLNKFMEELPGDVLTFVRRFVSLTDKKSTNIFVHYIAEYLLANDLFNPEGLVDFKDYTQNDFQRMFITCHKEATRHKDFKGPGERFYKDLDRLLQDDSVRTTIGLTDEFLDDMQVQFAKYCQDRKKKKPIPNAISGFSVS